MKRLITFTTIIVVLIVLIGGSIIYINASNYEKAESFMNEGNYEAAYEMYMEFEEQGGYKDSDDKIRECLIQFLSNAVVGDTVLYGRYEQDNKINQEELIEWIVLEKTENYLLLMSKYILEEIETENEWQDSDVRKWLNNEFYNQAFSSDEKKIIQKMLTSNETDDMVFLLSSEEVRKFLKSEENMVAYVTAYVDSDKNTDYWLTRSWGYKNYSSTGNVIVSSNGEMYVGGYCPGIRPVICVSISGETSETPQNMEIFGCRSSNYNLFDPEFPAPSSASGGSGNSSGGNSSSSKKCTDCNGTGKKLVEWYTFGDWGDVSYTSYDCPSCNGTGRK